MRNVLHKLWYLGIMAFVAVVAMAPPALAQYDASALTADNPMNLLSNGGFEVMKPAYWDADGDGASWTDAMSRTPEWSLELSGAGEASWTMGEGVRNWVPAFPADGEKNPEIEIGGWVHTDGVNTSPTTDDEKFQLVFEFFEDATQTTDVLGEPVVLDLPQDAATTDGWVEISNASLGAITFPGPQAAKSARVTFRKGANATGTAYLDDLFIRTAEGSDGWSGDFFNANFDAGDTWYYWWNNFSGGVADWPDTQPHINTVTNADAAEGDYSLRLEANTDNQDETVGVSDRVPVDGPIVVSFRVKHEGNAVPDSIGIGNNNLGLTVLWYENMEAGAAGYGEIGGIDLNLDGQFLNEQFVPKLAPSEDGWTQYAFVLYPPDGAVGTEIRPRYWNGFSGVTYWDDFFVAPLSEVTSSLADENELSNGGFEVMSPSYWDASGDGATWTDAMSRTPEWSLELSGAGDASWTMAEGVRNWVPSFPADGEKNPEIEIGGWVHTDGVNTAPTTDDEKFQLIFEFFEDSTQTTNVLGEPIVLDLPQDAASTDGWVEISNASLGAITFPGPQAAKSARVTFRKGANTTGMAYLDDLYIRTAEGSDGWSGDFFNANFDAGDTWYYWWNNFSGGVADWPESQPHINSVSGDDAYEGDYSLRLEANTVNQDETVGISERVPATPGVPMLVSFFVKHSGNAQEDSIGVGTNNLGITMLSYSNMLSGSAGYNEIGGADIVLNGADNAMFVPKLGTSAAGKTADADWTQYGFVYYPLEGAAGIEVRPRYFNAFSGVSYWDNVSVIPLGGLHVNTAVEDDPVDGSLPETFRLNQNYPNPFNPATTISFDLKQSQIVSLGVYNVLGQKVASLLDRQLMTAGTQAVEFNAASLPSGLYLYVLEVNDQAVSKKMVLLK
jgi:hypothetical protein